MQMSVCAHISIYVLTVLTSYATIFTIKTSVCCDNSDDVFHKQNKDKTNSSFCFYNCRRNIKSKTQMDGLKIKTELMVDSILNKRVSPEGKVNKNFYFRKRWPKLWLSFRFTPDWISGPLERSFKLQLHMGNCRSSELFEIVGSIWCWLGEWNARFHTRK